MQNPIQYYDSPVESHQIAGDLIEQLPSDTSIPSHNEIRLVDQFFHRKKNMFDHILNQSKDILMLAGLFILFCLPFIDNIIKKFITVTSTSSYILIGVKTILFVVIYFIIKNIYLVRKGT